MRICLFIISFMSFSIATIAQAQAQKMPAKSGAPVNIESESLVYDTKSGGAIFSGNVIATQDDVEITSNEMKVYSDSSGQASKKTEAKENINTNFKRIDASGNVKFKGRDLYGNSDKAEYKIEEEILTLIGNVYLNQKGNELYGEKFVYNMKTGKYDVFNGTGGTETGSKKRVKLVLQQGASKEISHDTEKKVKDATPEDASYLRKKK